MSFPKRCTWALHVHCLVHQGYKMCYAPQFLWTIKSEHNRHTDRRTLDWNLFLKAPRQLLDKEVDERIQRDVKPLLTSNTNLQLIAGESVNGNHPTGCFCSVKESVIYFWDFLNCLQAKVLLILFLTARTAWSSCCYRFLVFMRTLSYTLQLLLGDQILFQKRIIYGNSKPGWLQQKLNLVEREYWPDFLWTLNMKQSVLRVTTNGRH